MSYIDTYPIQHSTIMRLYSERNEIKLDPDYQRNGGVWTQEKKQLLIDSILNDYDIPKIYFHAYSREEKRKSGISYAVIDGRQRLETIWAFIEGKFCLDDGFIYQQDEAIKLGGLSYDDLAKEFPKIKIKFDSFVLPIIGVETDDFDLIEDMFSRLNEAAPLNAAEKRNAIGGDLIKAVREIANSVFFTKKVKFSNKRYQHLEVAARMLLVEESIELTGKLVDTKKEYLDSLAKHYREGKQDFVDLIKSRVIENLNAMSAVFVDEDSLLQAQGNMVVMYLLVKNAIMHNQLNNFSRNNLIRFNEKVRQNRVMASLDYSASKFDLLEYDRYTQQGTNDASNIKERVKILGGELGISISVPDINA